MGYKLPLDDFIEKWGPYHDQFFYVKNGFAGLLMMLINDHLVISPGTRGSNGMLYNQLELEFDDYITSGNSVKLGWDIATSIDLAEKIEQSFIGIIPILMPPAQATLKNIKIQNWSVYADLFISK